MNKLQFDGDITINQIFQDHRNEIYDNVLKAVKNNYQNREISEIFVVSITTKSKTHDITLIRDNFIISLNKCIEFFESTEEFEKCQSCIDIINDIENNFKNNYNIWDLNKQTK